MIDLETGEVLALHFGGLYQQQNYGVPASELARDSRVVSAGVKFAGQHHGDPNDWSEWWLHADQPQEDPERDGHVPDGATSAPGPKPSAPSSIVAATAVGNAIRIDIPLTITVALGEPGHLPGSLANGLPRRHGRRKTSWKGSANRRTTPTMQPATDTFPAS